MRALNTTRSMAFRAPRGRGTAATEFIVVLPLMLLIGVGGLDLGRAVQHYSVMSNAASAGAQCAATSRFYEPYTRAAWEAKVRGTVQEELASLGAPMSAFEIRIATVTAPPSDDGNQNQSLPRITVSVDFDFPTMFRWPGFPTPFPLHCESAIRQYR